MKHILYISILLFVSLKSIGQTKQGYIDLDSIRINLPENVTQKYMAYTEKNMELETIVMEFEDSIEILQSNYQHVVDSFQHNITCQLIRDDRLINKISVLENHIESYYKSVQPNIQQHKEQLDILSLDIVLQELVVFSKKHNIAKVEDKKSVLYCLQCKDYTEEFLNFLNED